ncbi:MAG: TIGR00266 family protein [Lachnospiraceae bacterium]|nr:TIGR00266 family protein [Lachnospiraceae bacterium]
MNYKIIGDSDNPIAEVKLNQGEMIRMDRGCMVYMQDVSLEGKMNSKKSGLGGVLGAIGRSMTSGESMFITEATGSSNDAVIAVAPACPGKIVKLEVGTIQYRLNNGAFLACESSVFYNMKKQDLGKALLANTGGLFVMETEGQGDLLATAFGDLVELEVTPDKPLTIDNEHVVAWDRNLDYHMEIASGTFGFKTGEGIVNKFHGSGKVLIQTRNLHSLADAIGTYLPDKSSY